MEQTYRLEFNFNQQGFHLDRGSHEENTHGWVTIIEHCTDQEFKILEAYIARKKKEKLTVQYILESLSELKIFMANLAEYNLHITHT